MAGSDFEVLVDCVRTALSDDTIEFGVFRIAESEKITPRNVIWIPTDFTCHPVLAANPLFDADTGEMGDTLFTDFVTVECQVSGNDFADACAIRRQVCNAVRAALGVSSVPLDGAFQTELSGHSGVMWGGASKIVQRFQWQINMMKPDNDSAVVATIEQRNDLTQDGVTATEELLVIT